MKSFREPSVEDYMRAFVELPDKSREVLIAHYNFPDRTATSRALARAVGDKGGAQLLFGKWTAKPVCEFLNLEKPVDELGDGYWFLALANYRRHDGKILWVMRENVAKALERLGWVGKPTADVTMYPDEYSETEGFAEGRLVSVMVSRYERSRNAREACIRHYGVRCSVCEFEFATRYGKIGSGFIHVHHLKLLSQVGRSAEGYVLDPISDLRPVCPNCHAMLHQQNPPFTIEELKAQMQRGR